MADAKEIPGWLIPTFAFLPWLVYIFASGGSHWGLATVGGLLACVPYLAILARRSTIKLMDWTTVAFFVAASVLAMAHWEVLAKYQVMIIWSFFAVAGWMSMVVRRPFTAAYAREEQPPEVWDLPIFHRINHLLTLFWRAFHRQCRHGRDRRDGGWQPGPPGSRIFNPDRIADLRVRLFAALSAALRAAGQCGGGRKRIDCVG